MAKSDVSQSIQAVIAAIGNVPEEVENLANPDNVDWTDRETLEQRQEADKNPPVPVAPVEKPADEMFVQMYRILNDGIVCGSNNPAKHYGGLLTGKVSEIDLREGGVDIEWQLSTGALVALGFEKIADLAPKKVAPVVSSSLPPIPVNRDQDANA